MTVALSPTNAYSVPKTVGKVATNSVGDIGPLKVLPVADVTLDSESPSTNVGSDLLLRVDDAPEKRAQLRFALPAGPVLSGKLRLHVSAATPANPTPQTTKGPQVELASGRPSWEEATSTYANSLPGKSSPAATLGALTVNSWVEVDITDFLRDAAGKAINLDVVLRATSSDGTSFDSRESANPPEVVLYPSESSALTIAAVGDIACPGVEPITASSCHQMQLSDRILTGAKDAKFLGLGDLQYPEGSLADYRTGYGASFGRFLSQTFPAPGNHEYLTPKAAGYYAYFAKRLPSVEAKDPTKGYYSVTLNNWKLISLNSNCEIVSCAAQSAQAKWLSAELATARAQGSQCSLAMWHHPRFSSGSTHGNDTAVDPLWKILAAAKVDVVLNAHEHTYERFDPIDANGTPDPKGIRSFIVGTGGRSFYTFGAPKRGSVVRIANQFGYLRMQLYQRSYLWEYINDRGQILDTGTGTCSV